MVSEVWQYITASGVLVTLMTAIITKVVNRRFDEIELREKNRARLEKIMILRADKMSEMVELMAKKLHDGGIINGDLAELEHSFLLVDKDYEDYLRDLLSREMK